MVSFSFSMAMAVAVVSVANAASTQRRAEHFRMMGYTPDTQVTDQAAIDLDQMILNEQVSKRKIGHAKSVYEHGGHSFSYALLTLENLDEGNTFEEGTYVLGVTSNDPPVDVSGRLMERISWTDANADPVIAKVQYDTSDVQGDYVNCQVGGLHSFGEANLKGCKLSACSCFRGSRLAHGTHFSVSNSKASIIVESSVSSKKTNQMMKSRSSTNTTSDKTTGTFVLYSLLARTLQT